MQLSPFRDFDLKYPRPIHGFLIMGVLCHIETQLSRNWVSTVAPFCRCLLDKLRQSSIHTISKDTMHDADTKDIKKKHYTRSYNVWHENTLHLIV